MSAFWNSSRPTMKHNRVLWIVASMKVLQNTGRAGGLLGATLNR